MEKRIILAVVLSFLVLTIYNIVFVKPVLEQKQKMIAKQQLQIKNKLEQNNKKNNISKKTDVNQKQLKKVNLPEEKLIPDKENVFTLKNQKFTINFSNLGASIKSIMLNKYFNLKDRKETLNIIPQNNWIFNNNPCNISLTNTSFLNYKSFKVKKQTSNNIEFEYILTKNNKLNLPEGTIINKRYSISSDSYIVSLKLKITSTNKTDISLDKVSIFDSENNTNFTGSMILSWGSGILTENKKENFFMYYAKESLNKINAGKGTKKNNLFEKIERVNNTNWLGVSSNYFTSILVTKDLQLNTVKLISNKKNIAYKLLLAPTKIQTDKPLELNFDFYIGPKDYTLMKNTLPENQFEKSIDYGWFSTLAIILLKTLKFFYSLIPNYGVAIILLTILINIILFPLKHKSLTAMEDMKKLQPLMAELKEKYKDDKARLQQETMALYKKHGVNPLGGCLPIFIQLPIFIKLYTMLQYAIELRGANFLYITDLSAADKTFALPIFMGITMFLQQKLTPMDPNQKKTMMFLPIIFTFMFLNMPAGLILYWTVFNIISILQQLYQQKQSKNKNK